MRRLVASPAAAVRLDAARAWLGEQPPDREVVVVAASLEAANRLCRQAAGDRAWFGWHRLTLGGLAARLAAIPLAARGLVGASPLAREALCARAVRTATDEELGRLAAVRDAPGLPRAVASTLTELRLAGLDDEAATLGAGLDPALAWLLRRTAALHEEAGIADRVALLLEAERASDHPLTRCPMLLVDVPLETVVEARLVTALTKDAPAVMATSPASDHATVKRLEQALGVVAERTSAVATTSLGRVQNELFSPRREGVTPDGSVTLVSSPGEAREAVEIARAMLAEARAGTRFDAMGVVLRSVEGYREPLREAFRRARIPARFSRGTQRPDPAGRALLALLACRAEQLSATRFAEYLSLGVVPHEATTPAWHPPTTDALFVAERDRREPEVEEEAAPTRPRPRRWERLLVDASVVGQGATRWERRLAGLAAQRQRELSQTDDPSARERIERDVEALTDLQGYALPLLRRLDALPERAPWGAWLDALVALAGAAVAKPERVLQVLAELSPLAPVGPVDLDEVRLVLEERLTTLPVPAGSDRAGSVWVGSLEEARGLSFEVVFVPGLAERVFPPMVREDPLLLDAVRETLSPDLERQRDRVARERLGLRLAAGAASRRLWVSYPRLDDEKARPRVPSFYGLELLHAAEGILPRFDDLPRRSADGAATRLGWPAPDRPEDAIDDAEFDLSILTGLMGAPELQRGAAAYLLDGDGHLARSLRSRAMRWKRSWNAADGLRLSHKRAHPAAMAALEDALPDAFAPTTLEQLAACPYRFYLRAVLRLRPRDDPDELEAVDARLPGVLLHDLQRRVLARLESEGTWPLRLEHGERALAVVEEVVAEATPYWTEELAPAILRVFGDAVDALRGDLREWILRLAADDWDPAHVELGFGLPLDPERDPASRVEPIPLHGIALRGAIDLVERAGDQLRATDHKSGRKPPIRGSVIEGGRMLQPLLYALALEQLFPEAEVAGGRLSYCTTRGGFTSRGVALDERGRAAIAQVTSLVEACFSRGVFPPSPDAGECARCDFLAVCGPYEEQRTGRKPAFDRLVALRREP